MSADRRLELRIEVRGELGQPEPIIRVIGEFERLQTVRFDQAAATMPGNVVAVTVDLTGTTIIDSAALGSLVRLRHHVDRTNAQLTVIVKPNFQSTVMRVGGLYDYLGVTEAE